MIYESGSSGTSGSKGGPVIHIIRITILLLLLYSPWLTLQVSADSKDTQVLSEDTQVPSEDTQVLIEEGILPTYAVSGDPVIVDSGNGVYVRSEPSTDSDILGGLMDGQVVTVQEDEGGDWIRISGGYVNRDYLIEASEDPNPPDEDEEWPDPPQTQESSESDKTDYVTSWDEELGQAVADYAAQYEGLPYVWGGESLETGADCSGFTRAVYGHFGVNLPHFDQYQRRCGLEVESISEAKPGDLVFYKDHVTIYLGNGMVINCSCEEVGTKIMKADYKAVEMVRRIFY